MAVSLERETDESCQVRFDAIRGNAISASDGKDLRSKGLSNIFWGGLTGNFHVCFKSLSLFWLVFVGWPRQFLKSRRSLQGSCRHMILQTLHLIRRIKATHTSELRKTSGASRPISLSVGNSVRRWKKLLWKRAIKMWRDRNWYLGFAKIIEMICTADISCWSQIGRKQATRDLLVATSLQVLIRRFSAMNFWWFRCFPGIAGLFFTPGNSACDGRQLHGED